jgi:pyrroloquinoline quinone biosynthesis protein D
MMPEPSSRPRLAVGCRLNEKNQASRVLHMPEKALRVSGPSLEIIERCDGHRTVQQIVSELQRLYHKAEPQKVEMDILEYLVRLHDQRALDFISAESDTSTETR